MSIVFTSADAGALPLLSDKELLMDSIVKLLIDEDHPPKFGARRSVYRLKLNPNIVMKVSTGSTDQNIAEIKMWDAVQGTKIEKYFAEVIDHTPDARVLIMQRTLPFSSVDQLPTQLPKMMADLQTQNFGMYKGNAVCHDYGLNMLDKGFSLALRKVDWSGVEL